ncbi:mitochondrial ribosomal protein L24 [Arctopsyche grandis]|uniref:mitochondrial ribosomal protein L24 n=1 Tax=Arctopsyche grandis TaxID=121162 RepID=UPI00406D736A
MRIISFLSSKIGEMTEKFSNLPKSYIERSYKQVFWRNPRGYPQYPKKEIARKHYQFSTERPWTFKFQHQNMTRRKRKLLEPILEWSFFKGDRVEIMAGRDKGKHGIISHIYQERNWVIVEGLNTYLKTIGATKTYPGAAVQWELPLNVTEHVKLVDPETLAATDIEWRFTEEGEKVRVSKATSRIIPIPKQAFETYDYKSKNSYVENPTKDTKSNVISEISFKPELKTFEMDIMDKMGIKEDRVPAKTFWY